MATDPIDQITLRTWRDADFEQAVTLNREAEMHIGMASETGDWARDMEGVTETFLGSDGTFLIGLLDEKFVVMGGYKRLSETSAEIKRMRVAPELQGHGIGRWFLGILETSMLDAGFNDVVVSTTGEQKVALRLYSGGGYTETGRRAEDREHDNGLVVVSFAKDLVAQR